MIKKTKKVMDAKSRELGLEGRRARYVLNWVPLLSLALYLKVTKADPKTLDKLAPTAFIGDNDKTYDDLNGSRSSSDCSC